MAIVSIANTQGTFALPSGLIRLKMGAECLPIGCQAIFYRLSERPMGSKKTFLKGCVSAYRPVMLLIL
jgi:hypothetical protein